MSDRRLTPANGRVAAASLRGQVSAERFVEGTAAQVRRFATGLHARPDGPRERQLLFGDAVTVFETRDGWSFLQAGKDGYCGHVRASHLGETAAVTHAVQARQSHVYRAAALGAEVLARLPFGARVEIGRAATESDRFAEIVWDGGAGFVPARHLRPLSSPLGDPAATAALFLGTPYLWGGNTGDGIDCSGLVQAACLAAGIACPGDSDLQAASLGTPLAAGEALRRNDVLFWTGHVALVEAGDTMIHATAFAMSTIRENIAQAIARIEAAGDGPVIARRRLPG